jgi:hypothetical protein
VNVLASPGGLSSLIFATNSAANLYFLCSKFGICTRKYDVGAVLHPRRMVGFLDLQKSLMRINIVFCIFLAFLVCEIHTTQPFHV